MAKQETPKIEAKAQAAKTTEKIFIPLFREDTGRVTTGQPATEAACNRWLVDVSPASEHFLIPLELPEQE